MKLKLNDAALKIEVNIDAVDLPSSPDAHVYNSLQGHITKLQVNGLYTARFLIAISVFLHWLYYMILLYCC